VVAVTTLGLCLALWPRSPLGLWPGTLLAGATGLGAAMAYAPAELSALLQPTRRLVLGGTLAGGVMAALTHAVYLPLATRWPALTTEAARLYERLDSAPGVQVALPIIVLVVVAEEVVWRGLAYGWFERKLGSHTAIVTSTLSYAVPQLASGSWLLPALAIGCGIVWTTQRAVSGSLALPILTHLTWDLLVMSAFPLVG
jgi:membrane protease YdiL (CAAX protease family)